MSDATFAPRRACPECGDSDGLWAAATWGGWVAVSDRLAPWRLGRPDGVRADIEGSAAVDPSLVGCGCGWEGLRNELHVLGIDGRPLRPLLPGQLSLVLAA